MIQSTDSIDHGLKRRIFIRIVLKNKLKVGVS